MADKKISELIEALNLKDTDILVIVQDNTTKKITVANAKEMLKGADGKDGQQGPQGPQGEKGDPGTAGKDGISITSVEMGTVTEEDGYTITPLIIHKSDTSQDTVTVKSKNGKDGKDGQQGPAGADGADGIDGQSVTCIKVSSEEEAIAQSTANPNNIYYW